jgi:hypothetical protein
MADPVAADILGKTRPIAGNTYFGVGHTGQNFQRILWQPLFSIGTHEPIRHYVMRMAITGLRYPFLFAPIALRQTMGLRGAERGGEHIVSSVASRTPRGELAFAGELDAARRRYLAADLSESEQHACFSAADAETYLTARVTAALADRDAAYANIKNLLAGTTTEMMKYSKIALAPYNHVMFLLVTHFFRSAGSLANQLRGASIDTCVGDIAEVMGARLELANDMVYGRNAPLCRMANRPYELFEEETQRAPGAPAFDCMLAAVDRYVAELKALVPGFAPPNEEPTEIAPFDLVALSDQPPSTREIAGRIAMHAIGLAWSLGTTSQIEHPNNAKQLATRSSGGKSVVAKRYAYWRSAQWFADATVREEPLIELFRVRRLAYNQLMDPDGQFTALMRDYGFTADIRPLPPVAVSRGPAMSVALLPKPVARKPSARPLIPIVLDDDDDMPARPAGARKPSARPLIPVVLDDDEDDMPARPPAAVPKPAAARSRKKPAALFDEFVEAGGAVSPPGRTPKRRGQRSITNKYAALPELPVEPPVVLGDDAVAAAASSSSSLSMRISPPSLRDQLIAGLYTMQRVGHPFALMGQPEDRAARTTAWTRAFGQWHAELNRMFSAYAPPPDVDPALLGMLSSTNRRALLGFILTTCRIHETWKATIMSTVLRVRTRTSIDDVMRADKTEFRDESLDKLREAARELGLTKERRPDSALPDNWYKPFSAKLLAATKFLARQGPIMYYIKFGNVEDDRRAQQAALPRVAAPQAETPPSSPDASSDFDLDAFLDGYEDDGAGLDWALSAPPAAVPDEPVEAPELPPDSPEHFAAILESLAADSPLSSQPTLGGYTFSVDEIAAGAAGMPADWMGPASQEIVLASPERAIERSPMRAPTPAQAATAGDPMVSATPVAVPPPPTLPPLGTIDTTQAAQSLLAYARARMHNVAAALEHVGLGRDGRVVNRPAWTVR